MPDPLHEPPDAAALLAIAADTLRTRILPAVPPDSRIHALMVLRALAIATRALQSTPDPALIARLDHPAQARLATEIRAGAHDPASPTHAATKTLLTDLAAARCAVSNPKALQHD